MHSTINYRILTIYSLEITIYLYVKIVISKYSYQRISKKIKGIVSNLLVLFLKFLPNNSRFIGQ